MDPDNPIDQVFSMELMKAATTLDSFFGKVGKPYWDFGNLCARRYAYKCKAQEELIAELMTELDNLSPVISSIKINQLKSKWKTLQNS